MTIPGIFSQRDPKWAGLELGWNTDLYYNIYHFGCAIDAAANILLWVTGDWSWTPARVNQWLKDNGGYVAGGGLVIWDVLANLMRQYDIEYHGFTTNLGGTNGWLAPANNYALAQLTGPGFPMHFSAMPYIGMIADSWDAVLKGVGAYTFIGAHLFSRIVAAPAPVQPPTPEPAPVQAPVVAPIPDPVPVPVPSNPEPQPDPNPPLPTEPATPPTGQTNGDIPIKVTLPEYKETYVPFDGGPKDKVLKTDTAAIDMAGVKPPIQLRASLPFGTAGPFRSAGTFTESGKIYYRGTSDDFFGVSAEDVAKDGELPETDSDHQTEPEVEGFWSQFFRDPIGALIRFFSKRNQ